MIQPLERLGWFLDMKHLRVLRCQSCGRRIGLVFWFKNVLFAYCGECIVNLFTDEEWENA
jgi:hypothetical protein